MLRQYPYDLEAVTSAAAFNDTLSVFKHGAGDDRYNDDETPFKGFLWGVHVVCEEADGPDDMNLYLYELLNSSGHKSEDLLEGACVDMALNGGAGSSVTVKLGSPILITKPLHVQTSDNTEEKQVRVILQFSPVKE